MKNSPHQTREYCSKSGSALITSIIFAFIISMLAFTFLKLATYEYSAAVRSSLYSSALNLAESGIEFAVADFVDGSVKGSTWSRQIDDFLVDRGYDGDIRYVVLNADQANPTIFAEGRINGHYAGPVIKQVKATISTGFTPFEKGLSLRNGVKISGKDVILDSYNSNYGAYGGSLGTNAPLEYGIAGLNKNDDIYVATGSIDPNEGAEVNLGSAQIFGYVSLDSNASLSIDNKGSVSSYEDGEHDPTRVINDFYSDFPRVSQPTGSFDDSFGTISSGATMTGSASKTSPKFYAVDEIKLSGKGDTLVIVDHVSIVMNGEINLTGKGEIVISPGGSLTIYSEDDIRISGGGVENSGGIPSDFYIYGTGEETTDSEGFPKASQDISISGKDKLAAAIYAPSADISLSGGGKSGGVLGGVVGFTASIAGNSSFHFDEALREGNLGAGEGGGVFELDGLFELNGATPATKSIDLSSYF